MKTVVSVLAIVLLPMIGTAATLDANALRAGFAAPPPDDCRPYMWGSYYLEDWPRPERRAMLRAMYERGIRGVYLWSRTMRADGPIQELVEDIASEGLRMLVSPGVLFSIYGGEFTTPATAWKTYRRHEYPVNGPASWPVALPGDETLHAVTLLPKGGSGPATVAEVHDGAAAIPAGTWRVLVHAQAAVDVGGNTFDNKYGRGGGTIDHLSATAVRGHLEHFVAPLLASPAGKMITGVWVDSWEVEHPNITDDLLAEFQRRRGYDARPWLHLLPDKIGNPPLTPARNARADDAGRFRRDYTRTTAELLVERFHGTAAAWCAERGLVFSAQAHGGRCEWIDAYAASHWPQCELYGEHFQPYGHRDAVSAAVAAGRTVVLSESYTITQRTFAWTPAELWLRHGKQLTYGVNGICLFKFHGSMRGGPSPETTASCAFDPWNTTFWDQLAPLSTGLARSCWLMRQGRRAAKIAICSGSFQRSIRYYPENEYVADFPGDGSRWLSDRLSERLVREQARVVDGRVVCGLGSYEVLLYNPGETADPATLTALARLQRDGARVLALSRPTSSGGLDPDGSLARSVREQTATLFPEVCSVADLPGLMSRMGIPDDLAGTDRLHFEHRQGTDWDVYVLRNRSAEPFAGRISLPGEGRLEAWDALHGTVASVPSQVAEGRQHLDLQLPPFGWTVLVRTPGTPAAPQAPGHMLAPCDGPWSVSFARHLPERFGPSPRGRTLSQLIDVAQDPELRSFAGRITYRTSFRLATGAGPVVLDLGNVCDTVDVRLDGTPVGTLIAPPWRINLGALQDNQQHRLELTVINRLENAFALGVARSVFKKGVYNGHFSKPKDLDMAAWAARAPANPSGLMGPVAFWTP